MPSRAFLCAYITFSVPSRQMLISVLCLASCCWFSRSLLLTEALCVFVAVHLCMCACLLAFMCAVGVLPVVLWHGCWCLLSLHLVTTVAYLLLGHSLSFLMGQPFNISQHSCNFYSYIRVYYIILLYIAFHCVFGFVCSSHWFEVNVALVIIWSFTEILF